MELIRISNTKLKIMLSESDMKEYQIGEEADCAEANTRRAIRTLLELVKDQIGFDTEGEEIFVQLYTSKHGGCELFVTKCDLAETLGKEGAESPSFDPELNKKPRKRSPDKVPLPIGGRPSEKPAKVGRMAFSFASLEELCAACRVLHKMSKDTESTAYIDEEDRCYLLLSGVGSSAYSRLDRFSFLYEYGERESVDCLISYINEHGRTLCPSDAVETLGTL